jgi:hypothetical protein
VFPSPINATASGGETKGDANKGFFKLAGRMVESMSGSDIAPHLRQQESSIIINAFNNHPAKEEISTEDRGMLTDDLYHFNMNK